MRRLSIAGSLQIALLGLTVVLTTIAGLGVAALYSSRQDYEDRLAEALELQTSAARLLAAGVVEEATLRARSPAADRRAARAAFGGALERARDQAGSDARSGRLVEQAAATQTALRRRRPGSSAAFDARRPLASLASRQQQRIADAREDARDDARLALLAIVAGGGLALLGALGLVAALLGAVRRPLDDLVAASGRLAGGDLTTRVDEQGPDELRELGRSFNAMAADLQSAQQRLEAERRRLAVTIQALGDGLVIVGAAGTVTAVNPRALELAPGVAVGATPAAGGLNLPAVDDAAAGEVISEEGERTVAITAARLEGEDGVVWTVRDVTERARLERLKTEFVATASHELRSPLTSIKGFIELLATTEELTPRQREFVDIVHISTNRLVDLVNDLLDVARIEAGRIEVHRRPTDLREVVREVVTLLRPRIEGKQQALDVRMPDALSRALADPARIRQVLTNLLTNAHLYTAEHGRLVVDVRDDAAGVGLVVSDTGRGMTPAEMDRVFDRFYRGGDGHTTPGTGLGLSIVRSLVELHHGSIEVESVPGEGTTFTVTIPRVPDGGPVTAARHALRGRRVLVLDDDHAVARLIAEDLEPYGVEAVIVHRGEEAIELLRRERFDAITVDILMPGMSGFEVLRALRSDPDLHGVPAVVVSVFSGRAALSGDWVVSKPIDAEELADALGAAVLAGRVRVLVVGRETVREQLRGTLDELGIEHEWAGTPAAAAQLCAARFFEVALVDAGLPEVTEAVAALDLRGRRLRRSVVLCAEGEHAPEFARLDAEPVSLADAGATLLGLLEAEAPR